MEAWTPIDWLRIGTGVFFIPHIVAKLLPPHAPLDFFRAAGFPAPRAVMFGAALIELVACVGLVFALAPVASAWLGAIYLLCACAALLKVGGQYLWLWNRGGIEYPAFWALACLVVAQAQRAA